MEFDKLILGGLSSLVFGYIGVLLKRRLEAIDARKKRFAELEDKVDQLEMRVAYLSEVKADVQKLTEAVIQLRINQGRGDK